MVMQCNRLKVRPLSELLDHSTENITKPKMVKKISSSIEDTRNITLPRARNGQIRNTNVRRRLLKAPSPNQTRIDVYFKRCPDKNSRQNTLKNSSIQTLMVNKDIKTNHMNSLSKMRHENNLNEPSDEITLIIIDSSDENSEYGKKCVKNRSNLMRKCKNQIKINEISTVSTKRSNIRHTLNKPISHFFLSQSCIDSTRIDNAHDNATKFESLANGNNDGNINISSTSSQSSLHKVRNRRTCPEYKRIKGTTFAVDAFQFGHIEGVTHYFLTHFHADHYIGLTKRFAMPLYTSSITARLLREYIPVDKKYIHELELNRPIVLEDVEITALEANHCPGAIMLVFRLLKTGQCLLHTGDFRASYLMESEPIFWNNEIDIIYLDTTYIANKYEFCTQNESIEKAICMINEFKEKHCNEKILYVCGVYVIGKERFWSALANEFCWKVWPDPQRKKALSAIDNEEYNRFLINESFETDMHLLPMNKLTYEGLLNYFHSYEDQFDVLLALRPSGREKNFRPQYRGKINIIGIEYSEHSSPCELKRFVQFLKPREIINTVPKTSKIPLAWYKYEKLTCNNRSQPTLKEYLFEKSLKKSKNKKSIMINQENINEKTENIPLKDNQNKLNSGTPQKAKRKNAVSSLAQDSDSINKTNEIASLVRTANGDMANGEDILIYQTKIKSPRLLKSSQSSLSLSLALKYKKPDSVHQKIERIKSSPHLKISNKSSSIEAFNESNDEMLILQLRTDGNVDRKDITPNKVVVKDYISPIAYNAISRMDADDDWMS